MAWLATVARNRSIDRLRQSRRSKPEGPPPADDAIADSAPDAAAALMAKEEDARLRFCLDLLEGQTRAAIREAFFTGLTYDQLARNLGVPLGTMKSRIRRGLAALRECLES
jgi:RNA polymerase sigma-70 factor (ECF subfamily)